MRQETPRLLGNGNYSKEVHVDEVIDLWKEWLKYVPRRRLKDFRKGGGTESELYKEFLEWLHDYYDVVNG